MTPIKSLSVLAQQMSKVNFRRTLWVAVVTFLTLAFVTPVRGQTNLFQSAARKRALADIARLDEIQKKYVDAIFGQPGVHGMGITANRETRELFFGIVIDPEVAEPALPQTLEGVPVQVYRFPRATTFDGFPACDPCHTNLLSLPVEMGNTGATRSGGFCLFCTLGFKACDLLDDVFVYVTCSHCTTSGTGICAGSAGAGASAYHRSPGDSVCALDPVIGNVHKEIPPVSFPLVPWGSPQPSSRLDAASVISGTGQTSASIRDIGAHSEVPGLAAPWDVVQKSGRTTGRTIGLVQFVSYNMFMTGIQYCPHSNVRFVDQIFIMPLGGVFSKDGDSGSAVLTMDESPQVVGLLIGGGFNFSFTVANKIATVLSGLDLSLKLSDCSIPCAATFAAKAMMAPRPPLRAAREFRDYVLTRSERGREYIQIYYRVTANIVEIMLNDPALFSKTVELFDRNLPLIEGVIQGKPMVVGRAQLTAVNELFGRYAEASANPEVDAAMNRLRSDLNDPAVLQEFGVRVEP